jgi:hypothetical protein
MMSLTFGSNEFFSTKFSTFLTQKIGEHLEVFVVLSLHLTNFYNTKLKRKTLFSTLLFFLKGKIKETNILFVKSKRCQQANYMTRLF